MEVRIGALPVPCVFGHQRSIPSVKTSKALAGEACTVKVLRTGAMLILRFMFSSLGESLGVERLQLLV